MSLLQSNELALMNEALTRFVLSFESTSSQKRKAQMRAKMESCYDQALHNVKTAELQARQANKLHNSYEVELYGIEAQKWRVIGEAVLHVMELVHDD